jgi:hypothetical protein
MMAMTPLRSPKGQLEKWVLVNPRSTNKQRFFYPPAISAKWRGVLPGNAGSLRPGPITAIEKNRYANSSGSE